jgi:hypothetical protein
LALIALSVVFINQKRTALKIDSAAKRILQQRYGWYSSNVATLSTGNDTVVKDFISCKLVFILSMQVFWVVLLGVWVIAFQRFEGMYHLHRQDYESVN